MLLNDRPANPQPREIAKVPMSDFSYLLRIPITPPSRGASSSALSSGRTFHFWRLRLLVTLAVVASAVGFMGGTRALNAATIYWDGTGTGWNTISSWSTAVGATTPDPVAVPGASDIATFSINTVNTAQTVNLNANQSALGLVFLGTNASPTTLLGGGTDRTLSLGTSGITVNAGAGRVTIGSTTAGQGVLLSLQGSQSFINNSSSPLAALSILNAVSLGVAGAQTLTLDGTSTAANTISGVISNGSGTLSVIKNGVGTWALAGANTFTGGVTLNAGTLNINHATALGATAGTFVINGGSIDNTSGAAITVSNNNPVTINANFTFIGGRGITHDLNLGTGAISLGTAAGTSRTITSNEGTLTLAGIIGNGTTANSLIKSGAGALTLSAVNAFTGGVTLNAGTLNINNAQALGTVAGTFVINGGILDNTTGTAITTLNYPITINGDFSFNGGAGTTHDLNLGTGATTLGTAAGTMRTINTDGGILTLGGNIANGTTANSLVKTGPGILVLGGTNSYTGTTTVNGGTLRLNYATNNTSKLADGAALVLGGGTVDLSGGSHTESVASTTLTAGTTSTVSRSSGMAVLEMNAITPGAAAFLKFTGASIATTDTLNTNGILGGWATVTVGGATDWATNSTNLANGPITAFTGYTDVNRLGGVIPNTATANIRIINGGAAGNITLAASPLTQINSLDMNASAGPATIDPTNNTDVFMIGGDTGGGVLQTSTAGALTIGTAAGDGVLTTGGTANATPAPLSFINDSTANALTVNSVIANNGTDMVSVAKSGTGALVLSGTNTYTGATTVSQGTLRAGGAAGGQAFGNLSAVTLTNAATVLLDLNNFGQTIGSLAGGGGSGGHVTLGTATLTTGGNNSSTSFAGVISGTGGSVTKTGTGTWTLSGGNSYTGATIINQGILQVSSTAVVQVLPDLTAVSLANAASAALDLNGKSETIGSLAGGGAAGGNVTLGANGVLTTGRLGTSTSYDGIISGATGTVNKEGAGTLTLTGANTFGTLNLLGGGVTLNNAGGNALANTANVRLSREGTTLALSTSETIASITTVKNSTISLGANTLTTTTPVLTGTVISSTTAASLRTVTMASTASLSEGMFVNGTGIAAGTRIAQILSATQIVLDQNSSSAGTNNLTFTSSDLLAGNMTGTGGFIKNGGGELRVTGAFTHSGAFTINDGPLSTLTTSNESTLLIGTTLRPGNVLSDTATLVVATPGTVGAFRSIDFVQNATNLNSFERIGGLSGGNENTTFNLVNGGNIGMVALGGAAPADQTWNGIFAGDNGNAWVIKEGSFKFSVSRGQTNDGNWLVDGGVLEVATGGSLDNASYVVLQNRTGASLEIDVDDTIEGLIGGGKGATRTFGQNSAPIGFLMNNFITGTGGNTVLNAILTVDNDTAGRVHYYGGVLSGTAGLTKTGRSSLELLGANTYTGTTTINSTSTDNTSSTIRLGAYGAAAGLGAPTSGGYGSLASTSSVNLTTTGGSGRNSVFDLNGANQTLNRLTATNFSNNGGNIVDLGVGTLTVNTVSGGFAVFEGSIRGPGNVNVIATQGLGWDLAGANTFTGTLNVTGGIVNLIQTGGNTLADSARVNVGAGASVVVFGDDTIGSISGGGSLSVNSGVTLIVGAGGSGAISATAFTGDIGGAGSFQQSGGGLRLGGNNTLSGFFTLGGTSADPGKAFTILDYSLPAVTDIIPGDLDLGGATVFLRGNSTAETVGTTYLNPGSSMIVAFPSDTSMIDVGGIIRSAGGTLHAAGAAVATSQANTNGILGGYATQGTRYQGFTWAVSNGAGLPITGLPAGSYTNSSGGANWASGVHYNVTANDSETGNVDTIRFNSAAPLTLTLTGSLTNIVDSGGILVTPFVGANTSTISGTDIGSGIGDLIIHQYNLAGPLVMSVNITDNPFPVSLTKAGQGTVILTKDNDFSGTITIGAGRLQVGNATATGDLGQGLADVVNHGVLAFNRTTDYVVGRNIEGTGWIRQEGAGIVTLGGSDIHTGRITVAAGRTLVIGSSFVNTEGIQSGGLGHQAGMTVVNAGGVLDLGGTSPQASSLALIEVIALKGATLKDNTTGGAGSESTHSSPGMLFLLGQTNTITSETANDEFRIQAPILGSPDVSASAGAQLANLVIGGLGTVTLQSNNNWYFGTTTINSGATLQLGLNSAGTVGRGDIINNGTLITNTNNGHLVLGNSISGTGSFEQNRNVVYLTGNNTYLGTTTVTPRAGENINVELRVGNDTYTGALGADDIHVNGGTTLGTSGNALLRYHLNPDYTLNNVINLNPNTDGTNAKNTTFLRQGLGSMTLTGTVNIGDTSAAPGTQRAILQTESGGRLNFDATFNGDATKLMNIVNNGIIVFGGTASNTFDGVLSGNNVWVFNNAGTTTLNGVNTFNTGSTYIRDGIVVLNNSAGTAIHDDNDTHVLRDATLQANFNETIGQLYLQRGGTVSLSAGTTLTVDDGGAQLIAGEIAGGGNLTLAGGNYMAMYGTNTGTGTLSVSNGALQLRSANDALGSFTAVNLGAGTTTGGVEYVGSGETFAGDFNLPGTTGGARLTANGVGALTLTGDVTNTGSGNKTLTLSGQAGNLNQGASVIRNLISGAVTEGANVLSISMPATANDDRFGVTGRWALINKNNDFSGNITVNVGVLEIGGIFDDGGPGLGGLGDGTGTTSSMGNLTAVRTIDLGTNNFDGRRYDLFGGGDGLGAAGAGTITNTLAPSGSTGTILFHDPNPGTATLGSNITFTQSFSSTTNPGSGQIINDGAKVIVINGNLTAGATGSRNWILDGTNTGINTIGGIISDTSTTGANTVGVIKEGAGTWRLSGANTYEGTTTVANGILQVSGGAAINDAGAVAVTGAGADGLFSGVARFHVVGSETIGTLTGNINTSVFVDPGQTLTVVGGSSTYNGIISGDGSLARTVTSTTNGTLTLSAKNTYTGSTTLGSVGASTATAGLTVFHLANGGVASGLGASGSAASNLMFVSNTANNRGGTLQWQGFTDQSTDRLFTMGLGTAAARINAAGTLIGTTAPAITFSNTGALALTGSGTRTLILGGGAISDNTFRPQITDGGGATTLSKVDGGLWLIHPDVAGNTYTGGTTITGGTLAIQAGNALGTGTITINGGAGVGLEIRGGISLANNITNSTADGGILARSGVNSLTGTVTASAQFRVAVDSGASVEISSGATALTGSGLLLKFGDGTLILSGVNNATGATTVRGGTLVLDYLTNNTSKLADAAALTLGGAGGLTTVGVDNNVAGQTNVFGTTGGTVQLKDGSHVEQVSATTLAQGANAITRNGGSATINLENITRSVGSGATIDFSADSIATTNNLNGTGGILNTTGGGAGTATGAYATVNKTDWAINSTNAADGPITALGVYAADAYAAGNNTDVVAFTATGGAVTTNTIRFNQAAGGTLTLGGTLSLQSAGLLMTPASGNVIITGGAIRNNATTTNLDALLIHQHSALGALQINSVIQNNTNAQQLTKSGEGKVFLNALNTQTGALNLNEGEIQVGGTIAADTTATAARLGGTNVAINMSGGTILRFLSTETAVQDLSTVQGGGTIILAAGNSMPVLMDTDNGNFFGDIEVRGGTLQISGNNNALGSNRGITTIYSGGILQFNDSRSTGELVTYEQGATVTTLAAAAGTLSGKQTLNNTTAAGLTFNIPAPATVGTVGLNITGIMYGSNGFTKMGNGILQVSANNFTDVYDGYTGANTAPSLMGQIMVNQGILYVGGTRALGAFGAGNETVVASGATVDLRDADLNLGDDSDPSREIFKIQGAGVNGTGALRNTAGTAQFSSLTLDGHATISGGGFVNSSRLDLNTFDTNLNNASGLPGNFTPNQPVIAGNNFDLTILGSRSGDGVVLHEPGFSSALNSILVKEGILRIEQNVPPNTGWTGISSANVTNGITIAYGGASLADQTNPTLGVGPNVGARLNLYRNNNIHHTVDITMNGVTAAANSGHNYIDTGMDTIPSGRVFLDGDIALTGAAGRNIIHNDSASTTVTVVEQGNLTAPLQTKLIVGGQITGSGGFTKTGYRELRLTNDNTFTGDLNVLRFGTTSAPWQTNTVQINGVDYPTLGDAEGWFEWGLTLNGANGELSGVANINLQRRGMITLDNTTRLDATSGIAFVGGNNNDRINNAATLNLEHGWLRINGGTVNNTETLGTVNVSSGTNIVDLYPTDGAGTNMTLTIDNLNRSIGGVLRIQNLDATSTFSTAAVGESVRVAVGALGATQVGGGGGVGATDRDIVLGMFGGTIPLGLDTDLRILGFNNGNVSDLANQQRNLQFLAGSHFLTVENVSGVNYLRPLDDSEYFTPANGIIDATGGATGQNVNLNDVFTIMKENTSINALRFGPLADNNGSGGTLYADSTLTELTDHHAIQLMVDGTLTISSGMISSAYFAIGNTSSLSTIIMGGNLDFGTREAIINNQNGLYRLTDGTIQTGNLEIRSNIMGSGGLLKTGLAQVLLDGANTYSGLTTISEGVLFLRNGRTALGVGGAGNGVMIIGNGGLNSGNGIQVGTAAAREDIYVGALQGDQQIMRNDNDVTNWYSNVTIDNVDAAGQAIFTPRIRTDNSATSILNGNIFGGSTPITNDVVAIDSRIVQFDSAGNNVFIIRGQIGDKDDGSGNAIPIPDPISTLPTLTGVRTNENEVLRVTFAGGSDDTNFILDRQYNAAGRLTLARGTTIINYDPTGGGLDGTGFWTNTALSRIPNADSTTTTFAVNGGTTQQGFVLGTTGNTFNALFLARAGQTFNMASWSTVGTGAKVVGGLNTSGTVTYGNGSGSLSIASAAAQLYAADGGTVVFNQRMAGTIGIAKIGRGTVELQNTGVATASDSSFELAGGTLVLNHNGQNVARVGNQNATFGGGVFQAQTNTSAATLLNLATDNAAGRVVSFRAGANEIIAEARSGQNMTVNMGNGNANNTTANLTRTAGGTANFVEWSNGSGTPRITMHFNSSTTALSKNAVIPWATYGTIPRTADDFAMVDASAFGYTGNTTSGSASITNIGSTANLVVGASITGTNIPAGAWITAITSGTAITISANATGSGTGVALTSNLDEIKAFARSAAEEQNDVTLWSTIGANPNVSEAGGSGFRGTLVAETVNSLHFDAAADSRIDITGTLTVTSGGIMVSSAVGAANKTISGGNLKAGLSADTELIIHHYGMGNLTIDSDITGPGALTISGPSTTNPANFNSTGAVVLGGDNPYTGKTTVNGAVLSIASESNLGAAPTSTVADHLVLNGGTLRFTGSVSQLSQSRGLTIRGNGGVIEVVGPDAHFFIQNAIESEGVYRGDLIKTGAGTLTLEGDAANQSNLRGLIDVRQGTLRIAGEDSSLTNTTTIKTMFGSTLSVADGTILRDGANLVIQMGFGSSTTTNDVDWNFEEWLTLEGNNRITVGVTGLQYTRTITNSDGSTTITQQSANKDVNWGGPVMLNGNVTIDLVPGQVFRLGWNGSGAGYLTGNGDIIKDGQGQLEIRTNNPDWTGSLIINEGRVYAMGQADVLGTGYLTGETITIGSNERQGIAEFFLHSESFIQNWTVEVNHDINVVYNPAQTKRLAVETFGNGSYIAFNGDITLNDNLFLYINDGAEAGGSQNYVNFNGQFKDGAVTSGNITFFGDDTGGANDNTSGRPVNYALLNADNSLWTGDVHISGNASYDQDQTTVLRMGHALALTPANDVTMNFNSILQMGGQSVSIGSLWTNGGAGPFYGSANTMSASANGSTEIIENADLNPGTLTITQTTPATFEAIWDAKFRDGTLNSQFFAPGTNTHQPSAALNLVKAGGGWATLSLDNDYTGSTTIAAGTLQVGRLGIGDTGAANAAGISVEAGAILAGTGIVQGGGIVKASANLMPGDDGGRAMGTLTFNGNTTLQAGSITTLQVQQAAYHNTNYAGYDSGGPYATWINGIPTDLYSDALSDPVLGTQHDSVSVLGTLTWATGTKVVLTNNGYTPNAGDIFDLLDWFSVVGTINVGSSLRTGAEVGTDLDLFELGGDYRWDTSLFNTHGILVVSLPGIVPEPGRMMLLLCGLLVVCLRRRRN